jgi:putative ABC transport system permease protein
LIAVITLALGIGANTAIFSVIYAVLLRPLPYPAAERLVILTATGDLPTYVSYPDYVDLRDRTHSFDDSACFVDDVFNVTGVEPAVAVDGRRVNWNFFQMLGVTPQLGRLFAPSDDQAGTVPTAAISDALWHEKFGGDTRSSARLSVSTEARLP